MSVRTQKINGSLLETHSMTLAGFSLQNSQERVLVFAKTFLLADISMDPVIEMFFLALSNTNIEFTEQEKLTWRFYIALEILFITSCLKLIDKIYFE